MERKDALIERNSFFAVMTERNIRINLPEIIDGTPGIDQKKIPTTEEVLKIEEVVNTEVPAHTEATVEAGIEDQIEMMKDQRIDIMKMFI